MLESNTVRHSWLQCKSLRIWHALPCPFFAAALHFANFWPLNRYFYLRFWSVQIFGSIFLRPIFMTPGHYKMVGSLHFSPPPPQQQKNQVAPSTIQRQNLNIWLVNFLLSYEFALFFRKNRCWWTLVTVVFNLYILIIFNICVPRSVLQGVY